jgi:hypothetical protein
VYHSHRVSEYQKNIYLYDVGHLAQDILSSPLAVATQIKKDFSDIDIPQTGTHLIVTCLYEAQNADTTQELIQQLSDRFSCQYRGAIFTAKSRDCIGKKFKTIPNCMANHGDYFDLIESWKSDHTYTDHKFLCLNRRPSWIREKLIWRLCHEIGTQNCVMSLGSNNSKYHGPGEFISEPMLVDGVVNSHEDQHSAMMAQPIFRSCAVKIITETTEQNSDTQVDMIWLTEKTYKCFFFKSFPIWVAVPGTVDYVRAQGFDTFDDIIDHGYDRIEDPDQRLDTVMSLVREIDHRYSIRQLARLREEMFLRLQFNYDLAIFYQRSANYSLDKAIRQLIAERLQHP